MKSIQSLLAAPRIVQWQADNRYFARAERFIQQAIAAHNIDATGCCIVHWHARELCIGTPSAAVAVRVRQLLPQLQVALNASEFKVGRAALRCVRCV